MQHSNSNRWDIGKESITRNYIQLVSVSDINQVLPRSHIKIRVNWIKPVQVYWITSRRINYIASNHIQPLAGRTCMYLSTLIENSLEPSTMDRERDWNCWALNKKSLQMMLKIYQPRTTLNDMTQTRWHPKLRCREHDSKSSIPNYRWW